MEIEPIDVEIPSPRNSPRIGTPSPTGEKNMSDRHIYFFQRKKGHCYMHKYNEKINMNFMYLPCNINLKIIFIMRDGEIYDVPFSNMKDIFSYDLKDCMSFGVKVSAENSSKFTKKYEKKYEMNITFLKNDERILENRKGEIKFGIDETGGYAYFDKVIYFPFKNYFDYENNWKSVMDSFELDFHISN